MILVVFTVKFLLEAMLRRNYDRNVRYYGAAIVFETRTRLTWRTQFWGVLFLCFIVSIPWEWYRLYRKAFASKQAQMEKEIPKHCRPDHELRPLESFSLWLRNSFTFTDDACVKYQEMLLVDPIWEISPSRVSLY